MRLRLAGLTHRQIGAQLGVAPSSAYKRIRHALNEVNDRIGEDTTDLRTLEACRLDELLNALWDGPSAAIEKAIDRVLRIMERRAKLLGLDAPVRTEAVTIDAIDAEIARLTAELVQRGGTVPDARRRARIVARAVPGASSRRHRSRYQTEKGAKDQRGSASFSIR